MNGLPLSFNHELFFSILYINLTFLKSHYFNSYRYIASTFDELKMNCITYCLYICVILNLDPTQIIFSNMHEHQVVCINVLYI